MSQRPHTLRVTFEVGDGMWPRFDIECPYDPEDHTTSGRPCNIGEQDTRGRWTIHEHGCWLQQWLDEGIEAIAFEGFPPQVTLPLAFVVTGWVEFPTVGPVPAGPMMLPGGGS